MSDTGSGPRIIAFASGKGGVGKSLAAANVAVFLATLGKRVAAIDAGFGHSSLHLLLGVTSPRSSLAEVLDGDAVTLASELEQTSVPGLQLVTGVDDPLASYQPGPWHIRHLVREMRSLDVDYVIVDLATGLTSIDVAAECDATVLLCTPEPTATEATYRWMRAAFIRALMRSELAPAIENLILETFSSPLPAAKDVLRAANSRSAELAACVRETMQAQSVATVINFARSKADIDMGPAVTVAARRRLGLPVSHHGHLEYDDAVWVSLRRRRPLLIEHPEARVSRCVEKVTRRLLVASSAPSVDELVREPTLYGHLEMQPGASDEEIRRSFRRLRSVYAVDSPVVTGLFTPAEIDSLQQTFELAHDTLLDPVKRKEYDHQLFPEGVPVESVPREITVEAAAPPPEARPPMPELDDGVEITGALLRQVREARGLDLREIAEQTKIGITYLDAIESERFAKLPAVVYVRGFLTQYAKALGLDTEHVVDSYLPRVTGQPREGET